MRWSAFEAVVTLNGKLWRCGLLCGGSMSLSLTKGLCTLAFVSISVTSKVRWRNALCFITKPQQAALAWRTAVCLLVRFLVFMRPDVDTVWESNPRLRSRIEEAELWIELFVRHRFVSDSASGVSGFKIHTFVGRVLGFFWRRWYKLFVKWIANNKKVTWTIKKKQKNEIKRKKTPVV
jgi:hypothetical protein